MKTFVLFAFLACVATVANAAIKTETVKYTQDGTTLQGFLAYDDAVQAKRPGVLVVHEWWGLNDYARKRATMLAKLGYVAFALDMYGEGKTTEHPKEAGEWAAAIAKNMDTFKARFTAAYDVLKKNPHVDPDKIAAIGYCFGGGTVLTMALAGVDLRAVVSFHGSLPQTPATGKVVARILVCHGADDPFTSQEQINTFKHNLDAAGADWEMNIYGHAKHSFTNPDADKHGMPQLAYNAKADRRSWRAMRGFLEDAFK